MDINTDLKDFKENGEIMKWTFENFGADLKDLNPLVRKKALEIANQLMDEGHTEGEAIKKAIKKAEEWFLNRQA